MAMHIIQGRPLEETLSHNTLWPETHKLYGHGNDVYTLAACPLGTCIVSACKAQTASAAEIWVWDCRSTEVPSTQQLRGHALTVTQMTFSHDGRFLLSVSRDRSFSIFTAKHHESGGQPQFELVGTTARAHERIIWSTSWAPDGKLFATGSRDKQVAIWGFDPERPSCPSTPLLRLSKLLSAVTAVAFGPVIGSDLDLVIAVGYETGHFALMQLSKDPINNVAVDEVRNIVTAEFLHSQMLTAVHCL